MTKSLFLSLLCLALALPAAQAQNTLPGKNDAPKTEKKGKAPARKRKNVKKPEYDPEIKGHPYFGPGNWASGWVAYDGAQLPSMILRYDLVKDEVVVYDENPDNPDSKLRLLREKVDSFALADHTFVRFTEGKKGKAGRNTGFYERLHPGPLSVWAKREKYIYQEQTYQRIQPRFLAEDHFYLRKDGKMHQINSQAALLKVLGDRKNELEAYLEKENMDLQGNLEADLVRVVRQYEALAGKP